MAGFSKGHSYCRAAIYKMIAGSEAEPNTTKKKLVDDMIEQWEIIKRENPDREVQTILLKDFIQKFKSDHMTGLFIEWDRVTKFMANEAYIMNPDFNGKAYEAINSMLGESSSIARGSGQNLVSKINGARSSFMDNFTHVLGSRNLLNTFRSGDYDLEVAKYLMDGVEPKDPNALFLADTYKNFTDLLYHSKVQAGIPVSYRKGYLTKTFHDPDKIASGGFSNWAVNIINNTKVSEYFKDISVADKEAISTALRSGTDLESMVGGNGIVDRLYEDFTRFQSMFDPITQEYRSPLIYENPKASTAEIRTRGRTYAFRDAQSWSNYNREFGRYPTLYDAFMADARNVAKENAFISQFGGAPNRGFNDLLDYAENFHNLQKADRIKLEERYRINAAGLPIPDSKIAKTGQFVMAANALAKLQFSALSQLFDPASIGLHYYTKSGQPFPVALFNVMNDYVTSIPEALIPADFKTESYRYMHHTSEIMQEETLKELLQDTTGVASKVARMAYKISGAEVMNRISYITAFKSVNRILGDFKPTKESVKWLEKYSMTHADLKFLQPIINKYGVKSPSQLGYVPDKANFEGNPLGISADKYQRLMASRLNNLVVENVKQFSPIPTRDMKIRLAQGANLSAEKTLNPNNPAYWIFSGLHQYKTVLIKTFMDMQNLISLRTGTDVSSANWMNAALTDPKAYQHYAATVLTTMMAGGLVYYTKQLADGKNHDEVVRDFTKNTPESMMKLMADSYGLGIMGDIIMSADPDSRSVLLATPAMQTYFAPFNIAYKSMNSMAKSGKPIDKATAKEVVDLAGNLLPLRGTLLLTPIIQDKKRMEKDLIKWLDKLDN